MSSPSSAFRAPSRCPNLAALEGPLLDFHYPARPVAAPSRLPGSAEFIYPHGSWRNWLIQCQPPGSSAGGLSQLPAGASAGLRPSQKAGREKPRDQQRLGGNPAAEFWLKPGNGLDTPYLVGEQGCGRPGS